METVPFEGKVIVSVAACIAIAMVVAVVIGRENKARWFRKRTKFSFFGKRGPLGDILHYGYPCTVQGGLVTVVMLSLMGLSTYCIFKYL